MCYYVRNEYTICFSMKLTMKRINWHKVLADTRCLGDMGKEKKWFFEFLLLHWTYSKINQKIALIT